MVPERPVFLRPSFSVDCYDQEYVDDETQCYHVALAVQGVMVRPDGNWHTWKPLIEGYVMVNDRGFWFDPKRPVTHPAALTLQQAELVLSEAFERLERGQLFDGDVCSIPLPTLSGWLSFAMSVLSASEIEAALLKTIADHNALLTN